MARRKSSKPRGNTLFRVIKKTVYYFFVVSIGSVILFKFVPIPFTMTMLDRKVSSWRNGTDAEIHYSWKSYNNVSREMHLAVVAAEDQNFPNHWGLDLKSMQNAYSNNQKGKKVRGGSTISQQTAKNVFLWQGRSYVRKALEAYFTVLIELIWGKQRILEVYVNVAETGKNTFGAEAAAQRIFNKPAKNLSRAEAARIAAVLPSPNKWSAAKPGPYVTRRTGTIQKYMRQLGGVSYLSNLRRF